MSDQTSVKFELLSIKTQINSILEKLQKYNEIFNAINVDVKESVKSNRIIPPGISTKISYDSNGLIIKGENLLEDDIPDLAISKIKGLSDSINSKINKSELEIIKNKLDEIINDTKKHSINTGTRINYDERGHVVSSSELVVNDIPEIPISKIKGLVDKLNIFETNLLPKNEDIVKCDAGIYTKFIIDSSGNIIKGDKLDINDIPNEIFTRFNIIENKLIDLIPRSYIDELKNMIVDLSTKYYDLLEINKSIKPNNEMSNISIDKIDDINESIIKKADKSDIINLYNMIERITNVKQIPINNTEVNNNYDNDIKTINDSISRLETMISNMTPSIPSDIINLSFDNINERLDSMSGRLSVLEQKLEINKYFSN